MTHRRIVVSLAVALGALCGHPTPALAQKSNPIISRITIRGTDIFDLDTNVRLRRFPYSIINLLHVKTQEEVIRQELLFKVGDRLDMFLIRETERNLRALPFIRAARVARFPQRDGTVVLVVHTNDSWTTEPQINLSGINRVDNKEFGFKEKNLFGRGKTIQFFYNDTDQFITREYDYVDPRLFGSRLQLRSGYISRTGGETQDLSLERPFFSADSRWSASASYQKDESLIDEIVNNNRVSQFIQTKDTSDFFVGTKIGSSRKVVNHAGLRYREEQRSFDRVAETASNRDIPQGRDFKTIFADLETIHNNHVVMTHLDKMTRVEDINLGPVVRLLPGISPRSFTGSDTISQFEGTYEQRILKKDDQLFFQRYTYSGRDTFRNAENEKYLVTYKYYHQPSLLQTLVVHTRAEWGSNLEADNQVAVGSENGLRAFKAGSFVGTKSFILNIEDRLFLFDELANLVSVGAVAYYDTGYAWPKGHPLSLSDLRGDVGVGLRFGLTRSSNEVVIRMDLSYRMHRGAPDDSKWVFSFGSGQAF